jgi:hypothetical protein
MSPRDRLSDFVLVWYPAKSASSLDPITALRYEWYFFFVVECYIIVECLCWCGRRSRHGGLDPPSPTPPRGDCRHCAVERYSSVECSFFVIPGLDPGSPDSACHSFAFFVFRFVARATFFSKNTCCQVLLKIICLQKKSGKKFAWRKKGLHLRREKEEIFRGGGNFVINSSLRWED